MRLRKSKDTSGYTMKQKTIACLSILLALAVALCFAARHWAILQGEIAISQAIQAIHLPGFGLIMEIASNISIWPAVAAAVLVASYFLARWWGVVFNAINTALNIAVAFIVKEIVHRPRPTADFINVYQVARGFSFPSVHLMFFVGLYGFLAYLVWKTMRPSPKKAAILIFLGALTILAGISRIYLGVHWITDVVGAYLIGGLLLRIIIWSYNKNLKTALSGSHL